MSRKTLAWFEKIMVPLTAIALFFNGRIAYFDTISMILIMIMSMFYLVLNRKLYVDLSRKLTFVSYLLGALHALVFVTAIFCSNAWPGAESLMIVNLALNGPAFIVLLITHDFGKEEYLQSNKAHKAMLLRTFLILSLFQFPCYLT